MSRSKLIKFTFQDENTLSLDYNILCKYKQSILFTSMNKTNHDNNQDVYIDNEMMSLDLLINEYDLLSYVCHPIGASPLNNTDIETFIRLYDTSSVYFEKCQNLMIYLRKFISANFLNYLRSINVSISYSDPNKPNFNIYIDSILDIPGNYTLSYNKITDINYRNQWNNLKDYTSLFHISQVVINHEGNEDDIKYQFTDRTLFFAIIINLSTLTNCLKINYEFLLKKSNPIEDKTIYQYVFEYILAEQILLIGNKQIRTYAIQTINIPLIPYTINYAKFFTISITDVLFDPKDEVFYKYYITKFSQFQNLKTIYINLKFINNNCFNSIDNYINQWFIMNANKPYTSVVIYNCSNTYSVILENLLKLIPCDQITSLKCFECENTSFLNSFQKLNSLLIHFNSFNANDCNNIESIQRIDTIDKHFSMNTMNIPVYMSIPHNIRIGWSIKNVSIDRIEQFSFLLEYPLTTQNLIINNIHFDENCNALLQNLYTQNFFDTVTRIEFNNCVFDENFCAILSGLNLYNLTDLVIEGKQQNNEYCNSQNIANLIHCLTNNIRSIKNITLNKYKLDSLIIEYLLVLCNAYITLVFISIQNCDISSCTKEIGGLYVNRTNSYLKIELSNITLDDENLINYYENFKPDKHLLRSKLFCPPCFNLNVLISFFELISKEFEEETTPALEILCNCTCINDFNSLNDQIILGKLEYIKVLKIKINIQNDRDRNIVANEIFKLQTSNSEYAEKICVTL